MIIFKDVDKRSFITKNRVTHKLYRITKPRNIHT